MRVAIVGGGFAGIAAAWSLSQQGDCEVHVYEKSWRLGGKAASTRADDGSIRTNNLQVWLGFYENAFRMMRQCYTEVEKYGWGPDRSPAEALAYARIDDAFFAEPNVGAGVRNPHIGAETPKPSRDWAVWSAYLPPAKGLPGETLDEDLNPFTLASYLLRCFDLLKALMLGVIRAPDQDPAGQPRPNDRSLSDQILNFDYSIDGTASLQLVIERMAKLLRAGSLTGAAAWLQAVTILEVWLQDFNFGLQVADSALTLVEAVAAQTRKLLQDFVGIDPDIRIKTEIIDLVLTIAVGLFRDRVPWDDDGLDSINQSDFRDWLVRHGATDDSVRSSFLTAVYDLAFAYGDGDKSKPTLAAGVALRGLLRTFFTYRGSMFWRLRSGMGEAVFAPLYKVLKFPNRKVNGEKLSQVRFHFLHELAGVRFKDELELNGKRFLEELKFTMAGLPEDELDQLSDAALDDFGFWPNSPVRFAAAKGLRERTLTRGKEFDAVILAIAVEDFGKVRLQNAPDGLSTKWKTMCDNVRTIATKSAQVWVPVDLKTLGWYQGSGLITSLGLSFDTWADMTPSLAKQGRPFANAGSLAFFCAPLADSELRKQADATLHAVKEQLNNSLGAPVEEDAAGQLLDQAIDRILANTLWVNLPDSRSELINYARTLMSGGDQEAATAQAKSRLLKRAADQKAADSLSRLLQAKSIGRVWPGAFSNQNARDWFEPVRDAQANVEGSDRYTLSEPGLISHRISPLDRSVENMTVAGDWTACGLDVGCVEAAVMSGLLASHAISKKPALDEIIGYDHP